MSVRDKSWYPIVYMFAITAAFSAGLIAISATSRERIETNRRLARERTIVVAAGLAADETPVEEIHRLFEARFLSVHEGEVFAPTPAERINGKEYNGPWLILGEDGRPVGQVVWVVGMGFWDEISGAIGLDRDGRTVRGIYFYEQKETPGLGALIAEAEFRSQFVGRQLAAEGPPIDMIPPSETIDAPNEVHAITGATQTSTRVERLINESLLAWKGVMRSRPPRPPTGAGEASGIYEWTYRGGPLSTPRSPEPEGQR